MSLRRALARLAAATVVLGLAAPPESGAAAPPTDPIPVGQTTRIEAEDFGVAAGSWSDTTTKNLGGAYRNTPVDIEANPSGGHHVGWIEAGEWLEYPINVQQAASYSITVSVSSAFDGARSLHVLLDGRDVSGAITFDTDGAGWYSFRDFSAALGNITAGVHKLRVVFDDRRMNIDSFTLTNTTAPPPPAGKAYPGRPSAGRVLWGASYQHMDVVARYEHPTGTTLPLRRSFYRWDQRLSYLMRIAEDDVSHGRIPWVSLKTPSWADVGSGRHDAELDVFLRQLDSLGGPVWLTFHHEPEGGGGVNTSDDPSGPAGHLAMNRRVRQRMDAVGTRNIALAPILMEWTWNDRSGRDPNAYWDGSVYDFVGIDSYERVEGDSLIDEDWLEVRAWAAQRGVDVAVAEFGLEGTGTIAANLMRQWYDHGRGSASDGRGARVAGLAAYDSDRDLTDGGWLMSGAEYDMFLDILREAN